MSSRKPRKESRRQQLLAAERVCEICEQKMPPEKDVAALMNMKTGKLACHNRTKIGALFHVFHVSCLIHWMLLCEMEIIGNQPVSPKRRRSRKKSGKIQNVKTRIDSVFCSECQASGLNIEGDGIEGGTFQPHEIFKFKIKAGDGRRGWMKSPKVLENCSAGFTFPDHCVGCVQKVRPLKLLNFYRAVED